MKDSIEIYTKVLIAFYGFIAPSFTIMMSIFLESIEKKREKFKEELKVLEKTAKKSLENAPHTGLSKAMDSEIKRLKNQTKRANKELNLLKPKRQIKRIFIPLSISLLLVSLYYFERLDVSGMNYMWIKALTMGSSFILFIGTVYVLWQLFCTIIDAKNSSINDQKAVVLNPQTKSDLKPRDTEKPKE